jgi:hypothetical protein
MKLPLHRSSERFQVPCILSLLSVSERRKRQVKTHTYTYTQSPLLVFI